MLWFYRYEFRFPGGPDDAASVIARYLETGSSPGVLLERNGQDVTIRTEKFLPFRRYTFAPAFFGTLQPEGGQTALRGHFRPDLPKFDLISLLPFIIFLAVWFSVSPSNATSPPDPLKGPLGWLIGIPLMLSLCWLLELPREVRILRALRACGEPYVGKWGD